MPSMPRVRRNCILPIRAAIAAGSPPPGAEQQPAIFMYCDVVYSAPSSVSATAWISV